MQRLRARWFGRQPRNGRIPESRKLDETQEAAVCLFIDWMDKIGMSVKLTMIRLYANHVLVDSYYGDGLPPIVEP